MEHYTNKKVLHIMNCATTGGISAVVLNYYRHIDRERFHFDCAMPNTDLGAHGNELKELGCDFFKIPLKSKHPFRYIKVLRRLLVEGNYTAIHVHNNETSYYPLMIAMLCGIPVRVAHAHTAREADTLLGKIKKICSCALNRMFATRLAACSTEAAVSIFGKKSISARKLIIINNSIDTEKFAFNADVRDRVRNELKLSDQFAVCCVGRMTPEKNHLFAIDVFEEVYRKNDKARLFFMGDGPLRQDLENKVAARGIAHAVSFLGNRSDINFLLQGMDVFILPSIYEGVPVSALEAAASGLPVLLSDSITRVVEFYSKSKYISLEKHPSHWAQEILTSFNDQREKSYNDVALAGFDIKDTANKIETLYCR